MTGGGGLLGRHVVAALAADAEVAVLDLRPPAEGVRFFEGSILDPVALAKAFRGADQVVHLAAAANIGAGTAAHIFELNARGTFLVLEAAREAGVQRVVLCSSDSVLGNTVWPKHFFLPECLPVDEDHPVRPADPYGLSKHLAEEAGRSYARRGLTVIALRPVFILFASMLGEVRARAADPAGYRGPSAGGHAPAGGGFLWHHVDPRDVAEAFRLALAAPVEGFHAYYLTANSTLHPSPTLTRLHEMFGDLPSVVDRARYEAHPFAPMFASDRAAAELGWRPRFDHRAAVTGETRDATGGFSAPPSPPPPSAR